MSDIDDTRYGYIHESAFLEGVERGKEDSAETISALRAEVERKAKVLVMYETLTDAQSAELTQLRDDRRVLADEVNAWRNACDSHNSPNGMGEAPQDWMCEPTREMKATNKSGALGRVT